MKLSYLITSTLFAFSKTMTVIVAAELGNNNNLRRQGVPKEEEVQHRMLAAIDDFDKVGNGYCKDATGVYYDYVKFESLNQGDVETCADRCVDYIDNRSISTTGFAGFEVHYDDCFCNFDQGTNPDATVTTNGSGTGEIKSVGEARETFCYKYKPPVSSANDSTLIGDRGQNGSN